jgi:hypothetical protein
MHVITYVHVRYSRSNSTVLVPPQEKLHAPKRILGDILERKTKVRLYRM